MPQLSIAVEGPAELIIAKSCLQVKVSIFANSDLKLILSARISDYFPVMDPFIEAFVGNYSTEQILLFLQKEGPIHRSDFNNVWCVISIPSKAFYRILLPSNDETWGTDFIFLDDGHLLRYIVTFVIITAILYAIIFFLDDFVIGSSVMNVVQLAQRQRLQWSLLCIIDKIIHSRILCRYVAVIVRSCSMIAIRIIHVLDISDDRLKRLGYSLRWDPILILLYARYHLYSSRSCTHRRWRLSSSACLYLIGIPWIVPICIATDDMITKCWGIFLIPSRAINIWIPRLNRYSLVCICTSLKSRFSTTWKCSLVKLKTVWVVTLLSQFVEFGHLFANIVTDVEFAFGGHHLVVFLVLQGFLADRIIADDFTTLSLVLFYIWEPHHGWTVRALNPEGVYDFLDNAGGSPDFYI